MKRNCIILHGNPSRIEDQSFDKHWMPWTKKQLEKKGIETQIPRMSSYLTPNYEKYKEEFERCNVNSNTTLIGHSSGCTFLVRWLGDTKKSIDKLILVAPWSNDDPEEEKNSAFYTFDIDSTIKDRVNEIVYFTTDNEEYHGKRGLEQFSDALPGKIIELKGLGHYTLYDMGTDEFPELIEVILR